MAGNPKVAVVALVAMTMVVLGAAACTTAPGETSLHNTRNAPQQRRSGARDAKLITEEAPRTNRDPSSGTSGRSGAVTAPNAPSGTPSPSGSSQPIRVASEGRWVDTDCRVLPSDNVWHARVDGLRTLQPTTPDGSGMAGFPVASDGSFADPLRLGAGLRSSYAKTPNYTNNADPLSEIELSGPSWARNSEYTRVGVIQFGPISAASTGLLHQHIGSKVLMETSSNDDHALFIDTDQCTLYEYSGWSRLPGHNAARSATIIDLETNYRRLSSRPGWMGSDQNGGEWMAPLNKALQSPAEMVDPLLSGMDGLNIQGARGSVTASGGSGLNNTAGMIRLDEVFATPDIDDQTVDPQRNVDHAVAASIPKWNITSPAMASTPGSPAPFTWPATRSDGCGGGTCSGFPEALSGSGYHIPMGSRLRLSQQKCTRTHDPQAAKIIAALCHYGIVVTDSSTHFNINVERSYEPATYRSPERSKWSREARDELQSLSLRDFELVDITSIAVIDTHKLWDTATAWAQTRWGAGRPTGWYDGNFWNAVLKCDRPAYSPGASIRPPCSDPALASVDAVVNSPDWAAVRD